MPRQYYAFLFFAVLGHGVFIVVAWVMITGLAPTWQLAQAPHAELGSFAGPAVFTGSLAGEPRTTPTGASSIAWSAWLEHRPSGKHSSTTVQCNAAEVAGLSLVEGSGKVVNLDNFEQASGLPAATRNTRLAGGGRPGPYIVDLGPTHVEDELTPIAARLCTIDPDAPRDGQYWFSQESVSAEAAVEVFGCVAGNQIVACPGVPAYLTTRDRRAVVLDELGRHLLILLVGWAATAFSTLGGLGGLAHLKKLARTPRSTS